MDTELEDYLQNLYNRSMGEAPTSPVATFAADVTPTPQALASRPRFDSMLEGYAPAINERRLRAEAEVEADRQAEEGMGSVPARELKGYDSSGLVAAAGPRRPLPASPRNLPSEDTGSGGGYVAALRRAQRMDDLSAAVGRSNAAMQQFAGVMSRGAFQPQPLPPMPSEVSKEEKRRQLVADYLKQQRDEREADSNIAYKQWLRTHTKPPVTPKPGLTQEQIDAEHGLTMADKASRIAAREKPRGTGAPKAKDKPRDYVGERKAEYEQRLKEGIPAGWELQPGAQPTQKQREDAAKIVVSKSMVDESVDAIRKLLAQPNAVANPATRELLAQQGQFVQTQLRVLEDLGVPSGPDAKILATLIGDPESIKGAALDTTQKKLDALGKYVGNRVSATTSAYGLQRKQAAAPTGNAAKLQPGTVNVRRKRDGAVIPVTAELADALVKAEQAERVP